MRPVHWIETELSRHFEDLDLCLGVDLDRNGAIEGPERTDLDGDGEVDSAEWQKFVGDNKSALEKLGGHFKAYYSAGTAFKPDNPIHDLLAIESETVTPGEVVDAYGRVEDILQQVKDRLAGMELGPEEKLRLVYETMMQNGIDFEGQDDARFEGRFIRRISEGSLDCDSSSYITLAVAREMGWPVYPVQIPEHVFVRWEDGEGARFNMDYGDIYTDAQYVLDFHFSYDAFAQGIYLHNMDYAGTLSAFYAIRALYESNHGKYEEAIDDLDRAIELNPNHVTAHYNRGNEKQNLGRYEDAVKDHNRAIELYPNHVEAYNNRGNAKLFLGRYEDAIKDYDRAIELDPNHAAVHNNRGHAKLFLGRYEDAIRDYDKAIELDPNYDNPRNNREIARGTLEFASACRCNTPGHGQTSDRSLLSLLLMLFD